MSPEASRFRSFFSMRKVWLFAVLLMVFIAASPVVFKTTASAATDVAYKSINKIKYKGVVYTLTGTDTRSGSDISNWQVYLPANFTCGKSVVVNNPATPGTVALRATTPSSSQPSPKIIGDCQTVRSSEEKASFVDVPNAVTCSSAGGNWKAGNNGSQGYQYCEFFNTPAPTSNQATFPLTAGCYSVLSGLYTSTPCPAGVVAGIDCYVNYPPQADTYKASCLNGLPMDAARPVGGPGTNNTTPATTDTGDGETATVPSDATSITCQDGTVVPIDPSMSTDALAFICDGKGGIKPAATDNTNEDVDFKMNDCQGENITAGGTTKDTHCGILNYIQIFINVLSGAVGLVITGSIIVGGLEYTTAAADAQKVSAAKARIRNAVIALITYLFFFSFLQWLVPGGIFK